MLLPSDVLTLMLQPDNPSNTTLVEADTKKAMYEVKTEFEPKVVTRVRRAGSASASASADAGDVVASWEWRDVRSDVLTLGSAPPVSASSWLHKSVIPFKDTVYFEGPGGKKYKWKGNGPGLSLELYAEDDKVHPVARFIESRRVRTAPSTSSSPNDTPQITTQPAQLVMDGRGEGMRDLVVVSFLLLEKSRRAREASTGNRADVLGTPITPVGKGYALTNGGV